MWQDAEDRNKRSVTAIEEVTEIHGGHAQNCAAEMTQEAEHKWENKLSSEMIYWGYEVAQFIRLKRDGEDV